MEIQVIERPKFFTWDAAIRLAITSILLFHVFKDNGFWVTISLFLMIITVETHTFALRMITYSKLVEMDIYMERLNRIQYPSKGL